MCVIVKLGHVKLHKPASLIIVVPLNLLLRHFSKLFLSPHLMPVAANIIIIVSSRGPVQRLFLPPLSSLLPPPTVPLLILNIKPETQKQFLGFSVK